MADKIVVLNAGNIEQYGSPLELYERPANLFVAGFIGSPKMNFIAGEAAGEHGAATHRHPARAPQGRARTAKAGRARCRSPSISAATPSSMSTPGKLGMLTARCIGEFGLKAGDRVWLSPDPGPHPPLRQRRSGDQRVDARGIVSDVAAPGKQEEQEDVSGKIQARPEDVALVTGGGQGIGLACAEALAEAGAKVVIADRDRPACRCRVREL